MAHFGTDELGTDELRDIEHASADVPGDQAGKGLSGTLATLDPCEILRAGAQPCVTSDGPGRGGT